MENPLSRSLLLHAPRSKRCLTFQLFGWRPSTGGRAPRTPNVAPNRFFNLRFWRVNEQWNAYRTNVKRRPIVAILNQNEAFLADTVAVCAALPNASSLSLIGLLTTTDAPDARMPNIAPSKPQSAPTKPLLLTPLLPALRSQTLLPSSLLGWLTSRGVPDARARSKPHSTKRKPLLRKPLLSALRFQTRLHPSLFGWLTSRDAPDACVSNVARSKPYSAPTRHLLLTPLLPALCSQTLLESSLFLLGNE